MLKKIIINFSIFFVFLVLTDLIIGAIAKHLYFSQTKGSIFKTTYLLEKVKSDIIILGSSKASHNYVAAIMQDSVNASCYNGGRDASYISYSNAAIASMLKRYKPKFVLLDVLDDEFEVGSYKIQDKLTVLFPYYKSHPEIREIVELKSPLEKYKLLSGMYTFNSLLLPGITGKLNLFDKKDITKDLGYLPLYGSLDVEKQINDSRDVKLDSNKIIGLKNIIALCNTNKVKLVIIVSPTYTIYKDNFNPTINLLKQLSTANKINFWNYLNDTTYLNNRAYFKDIRHLNNTGANIFTQDLIKKIKVSKPPITPL